MSQRDKENSQERSDLDWIIAKLDHEHSGRLPKKALRAAQERREEVSPRLIKLLEKATETVRQGNRPKGDGHIFALYLLTEFECKDALPAILEAVRLPDDGPFKLFADAITEDLSRILAALAIDTPDLIDEMIADRSVNEYVRWKAAGTYLHWVRRGLLTRDEAVHRLSCHLYDANVNRDDEVATGLVAELDSYSPREALDEIDRAFRRELVDRLVVSPNSIRESIAEGEAQFQRALRNCRATGVEDTVKELSKWAAFR